MNKVPIYSGYNSNREIIFFYTENEIVIHNRDKYTPNSLVWNYWNERII